MRLNEICFDLCRFSFDLSKNVRSRLKVISPLIYAYDISKNLEYMPITALDETQVTLSAHSADDFSISKLL